MPTYEYRCESCGENLEVLQKITEDALKKCPKCGKETLKRGPGGGIGLSFTGTGFYKTDYTDAPKPKGCCPCGKKESCS